MLGVIWVLWIKYFTWNGLFFCNVCVINLSFWSSDLRMYSRFLSCFPLVSKLTASCLSIFLTLVMLLLVVYIFGSFLVQFDLQACPGCHWSFYLIAIVFFLHCISGICFNICGIGHGRGNPQRLDAVGLSKHVAFTYEQVFLSDKLWWPSVFGLLISTAIQSLSGEWTFMIPTPTEPLVCNIYGSLEHLS